ncbi:glycosyl transferase [Alsobacter metallidurans]|uniref:Glycosyl transferase n=1 Tax=Alsobacter metallidurans TaxID=340221 RepID=A0A917MGM7_9HYPH|nr:glycosyltransferase family 4 protein [Alsobacter metallidurans]GGH11855.1 glycosyl transferase [Alsobacter metallidurans]
MRVVFHAPLKPPEHPAPSGDREIARLLLRALEQAGIAAERPFALRMFDPRGDASLMRRLAAEARDAAGRFVEEAQSRPPAERPGAVLTYHVHYKAPDVFGPAVATALGLPYVVVEGSRAPKRAGGPWAVGHALAEAALDRADAVLIMNARDRPMLEAARPTAQRLIDFPPFLDAAAWPRLERPAATAAGRPRLLAVGMMRAGDKLASFRVLAEALATLDERPWTLDVAGDGPARPEVEAAFARFGDRVRLHGELDRAGLARLYAGADLLAWPAVNEAFGMAFLEAALFGCPALAGAYGGVAGVVDNGRTGVLTPPGDAAAFASALGSLLDAPGRLRALSVAARDQALGGRTLDAASARLRGALAEAGRAFAERAS